MVVGTQSNPMQQTRSAPAETKTHAPPKYNVVLFDDDDHTYDYVMEMLRRLFGMSAERSYQVAVEVDGSGRVVVDTTTFERAELKRDQIHTFGRDWRVPRCQGSMSASIEPASG